MSFLFVTMSLENMDVGAMSAEQKEDAWNKMLADLSKMARALGKELPVIPPANEPSSNGGPSQESVGRSTHDRGGRPQLSAEAISDANAAFVRDTGMGRSPYEEVADNIPIGKFPYGQPGANFKQWVERFEGAVRMGTNCQTPQRLQELCLDWIGLKLNDEAVTIYEECPSKGVDWPKLKEELESELEDTQTRRVWVRSLSAYKKPKDMSLQIFKAKVTSMVAKYSPTTLTDPTAHASELYNRFIWGLEKDMREWIEDSIPYGRETLDNAFNQALKYEAKQRKKHLVTEEPVIGAAMTDVEKNTLEAIRRDLQEVKTRLAALEISQKDDESGETSGSDDGDNDNGAESVA